MFSVSLCLIAELMSQFNFASLHNLQNVLCNLAGLGLGWREGQGQVSVEVMVTVRLGFRSEICNYCACTISNLHCTFCKLRRLTNRAQH